MSSASFLFTFLLLNILFTFLKIFPHPPESSGIRERTGRRYSSSSSFSPCPDCSHSMPSRCVPARNEPPYHGFHSPLHCAGYRRHSEPADSPPGRKDDDPVYINRCYARSPPRHPRLGCSNRTLYGIEMNIKQSAGISLHQF